MTGFWFFSVQHLQNWISLKNQMFYWMGDQTCALEDISSLKEGTREGCSTLVSPVQTETPPCNETATHSWGKRCEKSLQSHAGRTLVGLGNRYAKNHWVSECSFGTREMQGILPLYLECNQIHLRPLRRQSTIIHGWNSYRNVGMFSKSCSKRHCSSQD